MFQGSIPALVTPFTETGAVDEKAFASHVGVADRRGFERPGAGRHHR